MLTAEKLAIYQSYNGDIDGWARREGCISNAGLTDSDWYLIDELIQGIILVLVGASKKFAESLESRIDAVTADAAARQMLMDLALKNSTGSQGKNS